jgi:hypothetical protein
MKVFVSICFILPLMMSCSEKSSNTSKSKMDDIFLSKVLECNYLNIGKEVEEGDSEIYRVDIIKPISSLRSDIQKVVGFFLDETNSKKDYPGAGINNYYVLLSDRKAFLLREINHDNIFSLEELVVKDSKYYIDISASSVSQMRIISSRDLYLFLDNLKKKAKK